MPAVAALLSLKRSRISVRFMTGKYTFPELVQDAYSWGKQKHTGNNGAADVEAV